MRKDEILALSRQENKDKDLYGEEIVKRGFKIIIIVPVIIAAVLLFTELFINGNRNFSLLAVINSITATMYIYRAIMTKDKGMFACGIIWCVATVVTFALSIGYMFLQH